MVDTAESCVKSSMVKFWIRLRQVVVLYDRHAA